MMNGSALGQPVNGLMMMHHSPATNGSDSLAAAAAAAAAAVHAATANSVGDSKTQVGKVLKDLNVLAGKISPKSSACGSVGNRDDVDMITMNSPNGGLNSSNSGHGSPTSESPQNIRDGPDPDAIKMFVGQIPKSMDEADLKKMFEEYGEVYQVNVLRDKVTGQSKGCCFVTFYARKAALNAQNDLHNIKTLSGMHHPIQMKPADTENRNERKLFIGMLSKKVGENDVRAMFSQFGQIEECTVLRDANNHSKGCAFVTFTTRQSAINAIKGMHHSTTMEGCSSPLVVKFADTQKEKDQKRLHQMAQNIWSMSSMNNLAALAPQYLSILQAAMTSTQSPATPAAPTATQASNPAANLTMAQLASLNPLQIQQLIASLSNIHNAGSGQLGIAGVAALQNSTVNHAVTSSTDASNLQGLAALANLSVANQGLNPMSMQNLATLAAMTSGNSAAAALLNPAGSSNSSTPSLSSSAFPGMFGGPGAGVTGSLSTTALAQQAALAASTQAGKQVEGPEGANLFIYHLPQDFGDTDLIQAFAPFGTVISAKVFIDKHTNLSKCFGFVSYDNSVSAQQAIQAMNGFQIGTKRLKVQLKRSKDASKPY